MGSKQALILFGGLVALMALGLPVAFAFLAINIIGAGLFFGGETGLVQFNAQRGAIGHQPSPDADPVLRADGRGAVPLRRRR